MVMLAREPFEKQCNALRHERSPFDAYYKELRGNFYSAAGRFDDDKPNDIKNRNRGLLDISPLLASRTAASGMMAGITSPARPWFRLGAPDPGMMSFGPVKEYLHSVEVTMREVFNRSNLYNVLPRVYREVACFGTAVMAAVPDFDEVVRFHTFTVGQYWLALNGQNRVDTFYRKARLTVRQVVELAERLGGAASKNVQSQYDRKDYMNWVDVIHCVMPNPDYRPNSPFARHKRFLSVYYEMAATEKSTLAVTGYDKFVVMAPRWEVGEGDAYGIDCPGMTALPDAKQLQVQQKRKAKAIAAMSAPPTQSPSSQGKNIQYNILPGTHSTYDAGGPRGIETIYQVNPNVEALNYDIDITNRRINSAFFADLFLQLTLSDRRQITAREIEERHEEKLLMLGPVLERLHTDMLDPLIDITYTYMNDAGILPPPPEELQGQNIKVEYISVLAQAQHSAGMGALERTVGFISTLAQAKGDQSVWDTADTDDMVKDYANMAGTSPKNISSDEEIAARRQSRAQQEQQAQQIAAAQQIAGAAKDASAAAANQQGGE